MFSLKKKQKKGCEWVPAQGLVTAESGGRLLLSPKVVMFAMRSEGRGRPAERTAGPQLTNLYNRDKNSSHYIGLSSGLDELANAGHVVNC